MEKEEGEWKFYHDNGQLKQEKILMENRREWKDSTIMANCRRRKIRKWRKEGNGSPTMIMVN